MHFLEVFAVGGLLAAAIFHIGMILVFEHMASKINKFGPNLVTKIGTGLPEIDLQSPLIPLPLKNQFLLYRRAWIVVMAILMMPLALYLIAKAYH
ncbi:hypothetical protein HJB56_01200 [Rhizobium lentis]|uniref:hypothetical protein n=1 Tax=Rhizobium lentis TaxID=1138194 RepID=UPI001C83F9BA|nr:hypothetical protein [Rhizobium lentis]MBX5081416.1 hypothetical protein [Rhizobium lentis]MBX5094125.1 hypothetical protein [Rhizobium lentis]MBX5118851.1 hypothetical protein [Rhizobium lentis]MBX5125175.1 hypothetical protein [Rhizobium lentis]